MKDWLSNNKKILSYVVIISIAVILCVALTIGIINGSISAFVKNMISVLAPVIIGFAIAYLCNHLVSFFENTLFKKIPKPTIKRVLSIILSFLIIILALSFIILQLIPEFISAISSLFNTYLADYQNTIRNFIGSVNDFVASVGFLRSFIEPFDPEAIIVWVEEQLAGIKSFDSEFSEILSRENIWTAIGYIFSIGTSVVNGIKNFLLGIFISFYMLMAKDRVKAGSRRFLNAILSPKKVRSVIRFGKLVDRTFGGFIQGQLLDAIIVGIISYIVFSIFGIPSAYVISVIIAVTNVIPILGPFLGAIPSAFIVLLIDPPKTILFILLILIIQQIDGNIICPKIIGDKINISSLAVIVSIIVMGGLFGIPGMILGVPFFAVAIHMIQNWIINRLRAKDLETSIEHYYIGDSEEVIENTDKSKKLVVRAYNGCVSLIKKIGLFFKKLFTRKKKK